MKITRLAAQQQAACSAVVMVRHEAFGRIARPCGGEASWVVETAWHAAKRHSSLDGSALVRFTKRTMACDAHAALAQSRVELLNKF